MQWFRNRGRSLFDNILYDALKWGLGSMLLGLILLLGPSLAFAKKLYSQEPVPWTVFICVTVIGFILVAVAICLFIRVSRQVTTHPNDKPDGARTHLVSEIRNAAIEREFGPRNVPPALTEAQRHEAWEKDQAEKGISITLPRSFTPPTAAQRQQLAELKQKLVNLREKGKRVAAMPEPRLASIILGLCSAP
jgi:large-conductance mechanosensitive channel